MATLPALAGPNMNRVAVRIEVGGAERCQFPIPGAGYQRPLHQLAEVRFAGIHQPFRLRDRQMPHPRGVDLFEGLDTTPSIVGVDLVLTPRTVEGGPQNRPGTVGA